MGQIFCSRGRPVEQFYWTSSRFQGTSNRNSTGRPVEIFIAFLDEISNSKTFEANLQNSSGRPVESYWTSSRIQRTSNRSSTGRPLEQKIWANMTGTKNIIYLFYHAIDISRICSENIQQDELLIYIQYMQRRAVQVHFKCCQNMS